MKLIGLLMVLAGGVLAWGIGYRGLTADQLKADLGSWLTGGPTVA